MNTKFNKFKKVLIGFVLTATILFGSSAVFAQGYYYPYQNGYSTWAYRERQREIYERQRREAIERAERERREWREHRNWDRDHHYRDRDRDDRYWRR